jgi:protein-tyrosine phosphatase
VPQSNDDVAEPLKIPGVAYHEINFNGSSFSRMLISKLSWREFFKLIWLMATGYRKDAIKILAPHMEEMGLVGLAIESLDVCTSEVKQVFNVLAKEENWPVLVHCTQGKDRTGLIVMLLLFLLEVDVAAVEKDYLLSGPELEAERAERVKEIQSIGLSEQFALCPPDVVSKVHAHLEEKYGGVEAYLQSTGVTKEQIAGIKHTLRGDV